MTRTRLFILVAFLLTSLSVPLSATLTQDHQWTPIKTGSIGGGLKVTGHVIPQDGALSVEAARVQGRVIRLLKKEGDWVHPGDPLLEVQSADGFSLEEELRSAKEKKLSDLEQAVRQRQSELSLKASHGHCYILSAHSGVITKRTVEVGTAFNIGDSLMTVLDVHRMTIECDVPESDFSNLREKAGVKVKIASMPDRTFNTHIQTILPTIDTLTRTVKVRLSPISLPENIKLDTLVYADISVKNAQSQFVVPTNALVFYKDNQYVIKQTAQTPVVVRVRVLNETENVSAIFPVNPNALQAGDWVAAKGAIYLFQKFVNGPPSVAPVKTKTRATKK